jgi:hypothetical protein
MRSLIQLLRGRSLAKRIRWRSSRRAYLDLMCDSGRAGVGEGKASEKTPRTSRRQSRPPCSAIRVLPVPDVATPPVVAHLLA